jgi:hypothetical protein
VTSATHEYVIPDRFHRRVAAHLCRDAAGAGGSRPQLRGHRDDGQRGGGHHVPLHHVHFCAAKQTVSHALKCAASQMVSHALNTQVSIFSLCVSNFRILISLPLEIQRLISFRRAMGRRSAWGGHDLVPSGLYSRSFHPFVLPSLQLAVEAAPLRRPLKNQAAWNNLSNCSLTLFSAAQTRSSRGSSWPPFSLV